MMKSPAIRLMTAAACMMLTLAPVPSGAAEPSSPVAATGDLWEVTSQMSMEGMPMAMPASKTKVCAPKDWTQPPGGADERHKCTSSDFKLVGSTATWKVTCAGPPRMTGDGEITRDGTEAYSGTIKFSSSEGNMTIKLQGRRLDTCTPK